MDSQLPVLVILKINVKLFFTLMILFGYLLPCLWTVLHCYLYVHTTTTITVKFYTFARTKKKSGKKNVCVLYDSCDDCVSLCGHTCIYSKTATVTLIAFFFFLHICVYTHQSPDSNKALAVITFFLLVLQIVIQTNQSFDAINQQNVDIWWTRQGIWSPVLQSLQ